MKKIMLFMLLCVTALTSNAQIYSKIEHYDKFDDCIRKENIKTLININEDDEVITVETKGRKKEKYLIFYKFTSTGDENNVINLAGNVYGYESCYYCISLSDSLKFQNDFLIPMVKKYISEDESLMELISKEDKTENEESILNIETKLCLNKIILKVLELDKDGELPFYIKTITNRTITTQYTMQFLDRLFWIKYSDGSRKIYRN